MSYTTVIQQIADRILSISLRHPIRVGINGVDGSGKTIFAQQLVEALHTTTDRQIISASIDQFHNPKTVRYQKGRDSAEGFYEDSFQYSTLKKSLLNPLGANGNRRYKSRVFDLTADQPVAQPEEVAPFTALTRITGPRVVERRSWRSTRSQPQTDIKIILCSWS